MREMFENPIPKYIFFDVGDTLLRKRTSVDENLARVFGIETRELEKAKAELMENLPKNLERKFRKIRTLKDQLEYFKEFYKLLCKKLGFEITEKRIKRMLDCRLNEDMILAEEDIPKVLDYLEGKGHELGIITNAFPSLRYFDLKIASLDKHFDPIVTTGEEGISKNEEEIYEIALERAGTSPKESMFIDNKISYLETAKKAGIKHLVLLDKEENHPESQFKLINSINELVEIL